MYSSYNQQKMNYHLAKKHAPSTSKQSTVCSSCEKEFPTYYSIHQHRIKEHGANNGSQVIRGRWRETQRRVKCLSAFPDGYSDEEWEA